MIRINIYDIQCFKKHEKNKIIFNPIPAGVHENQDMLLVPGQKNTGGAKDTPPPAGFVLKDEQLFPRLNFKRSGKIPVSKDSLIL